MMGIVFNLLEHCVEEEFGEGTWDNLLDAAGVDGVYTALGNYPDSELLAIVSAACDATGKEAAEIVRWFGQAALPLLAQRYPDFFTPHQDTRSFLKTLNDIIHPEVRKLYPGADAPDFTYQDNADGSLAIGYHSKRDLLEFGEGLILGAAEHYGDTVNIAAESAGEHQFILHCTFGER